MHELALMQSVVAAVLERVGPARVTTVRLEVGELSCAAPQALRFCFEACAAGTSLARARLDIRTIGASAVCRRCGQVAPIDRLGSLCACGSADLDLLSGLELRLKEVEVE